MMRYSSGNTYEGSWQNDRKNGFGVMIWRDLDEIYTGRWLDDKPHGYGEHIWGDSAAKIVKKQCCNMYRGYFDGGQRHGKGVFFYMNGSSYTGSWREDLKHGPGVFVHADGRITSGDYESNRLVLAADSAPPPQPTSRSSNDDINAQYILHIDDILAGYAILPEEMSLSPAEIIQRRMRTMSELQRLLLKYNSFLKIIYRKFNELANRQRQRETLWTAPAVPVSSEISIKSAEEKAQKITAAAVNARSFSRRHFCSSLEQFVRFLREIGLLSLQFNAFDVVKALEAMNEQHLTIAVRNYREYLRSLPSNDVEPEDDEPQRTTMLRRQAELKSRVVQADLGLGQLLDDYLQGQSQVQSPPMLEHQFVELFVRTVLQIYGSGHDQSSEAAALSPYQALEKILAEKVLPLAGSEALAVIPLFYREFYDESVQDILHDRPNKSFEALQGRVVKCWEEVKGIAFADGLYEADARMSTGSILGKSGFVTLKQFLSWSMQRTSKLVRGNVSEEQLVSVLLDQCGGEASQVREMDFQDFLEYLCRVLMSDLSALEIPKEDLVAAEVVGGKVAEEVPGAPSIDTTGVKDEGNVTDTHPAADSPSAIAAVGQAFHEDNASTPHLLDRLVQWLER